MRRDQRQQFAQRGLVGHSAAMQADVQFDVDAHPGTQPLGQRQVLTQALRRIDQPLQLPRRVERTLVLAVEQFRRTHRQRLAEEDVGIRKSDRVVVENGWWKDISRRVPARLAMYASRPGEGSDFSTSRRCLPPRRTERITTSMLWSRRSRSMSSTGHIGPLALSSRFSARK